MKKIFEYKKDELGESLNCGGIAFETMVACCLRPINLIYRKLSGKDPKIAATFRQLIIVSVMNSDSPLFDITPDDTMQPVFDICVVTPKRNKGESGK